MELMNRMSQQHGELKDKRHLCWNSSRANFTPTTTANIVQTNLIPNYGRDDITVYGTYINIIKLELEEFFWFVVLKVTDENSRIAAGSGAGSESGFVSLGYGSADPDPYQNVMDPQHCFLKIMIKSRNVEISVNYSTR
jgi:hypothetical protein